jgi:hypothetical protein
VCGFLLHLVGCDVGAVWCLLPFENLLGGLLCRLVWEFWR